MIRRMKAVYSGRVQNVGFRSFAAMHAQSLNLTGYARNLEDGNAEVEVQGEETAVTKYLGILHAGSQFIRIDHVDLEELPVKENERRFTYEW